jgi:hypothetical protein
MLSKGKGAGRAVGLDGGKTAAREGHKCEALPSNTFHQ